MVFFKEEYDSHYWSELGKVIHRILLSPNSERPFIPKKDQLSETFIPPGEASFTAWRENGARFGKMRPMVSLCLSVPASNIAGNLQGRIEKQTWSVSRNGGNIHSCKMRKIELKTHLFDV